MSLKDSLDVLYLMFQWKTTFELSILVNGATHSRVMNNDTHDFPRVDQGQTVPFSSMVSIKCSISIK